jgi:hypothetical protein
MHWPTLLHQAATTLDARIGHALARIRKVESGFPKSMPSGSTRGTMLKQKARAGCRSNHHSSRSRRRICAMPAALRARTRLVHLRGVGGAEIARVGSASAVLIDLLDERRTQGRPRRWAPARAHCQIEVRSNKWERRLTARRVRSNSFLIRTSRSRGHTADA